MPPLPGSPGAALPPPVASGRRLAPLLVGAVLLLIAAVAAGWWWTERQPGRAAAVSKVPPPVVRKVVPDPTAVRLQNEAAARAAQAAQATELARQAQQQEIDDHLEQARAALTGKHYDDAAAAASAVLALAPGNTDAQGILATAEKAGKAEKRRRDRAAQAREASARPKPVETLPPVPRPATPTPAVVAPVPTDATLAVNFFTNLPEGVLVVYVNDRQVMRESFEYYTKTGFLRSKPSKGWVRNKYQVPVGTAAIRVYVSYSGKRTEVKSLSGNFSGGALRTLNATLNEDGSLTARLD